LLSESLESRRVLAVYLPDSFANNDAQPVATAFNSGEQVFYGGHSGELQFAFGSTAAGSSYSGPGWNLRDVNNLVGSSLGEVAGTPSLYQGVSSGGDAELHAVYRTTTGKLVDVWSSPWQSRELVTSGVVSNPTASSVNGGRQVLYVGDDGHVHFVASADFGGTWHNTDLQSLVGVGADSTATAVATSGVVALQVGTNEYYGYHRADGGLGLFVWNGSAWSYDILDTNDFASYVPPTTGAKGQMEGVYYATTGATNPNVGWIFFRDGYGTLRGVWLTEGGTWNTAKLSNMPMQGAPSAAFDPSAQQVSASFVDVNGHLHLLTEGSTWSDLDFHAAATLPMPLANMGNEVSSSGRVLFADASYVDVKAAVAGSSFNGVTVKFQAGTSLTATYDSAAKVITVSIVGPAATKFAIANAIDALPEFDARAGGSGNGFVTANDTFGVLATLSGGTSLVPGAAVKPDLYYRPHASAGVAPGLQIVYKDQSNHIQNVRVSDAVAFDSTAYMEGYKPTYGYGLVNAARAVAYAMNSPTSLDGPGSGSWNLSLIRAPSVWTTSTGQNVAVFSLDSGIDTANADSLLLTGYNAASGNSNTADNNGHGTAMASLINGTNDGAGVTGVAYNARVVPVKLGDSSVLNESTIVSGIDYALNYTLPAGYAPGARVINMSIGSTTLLPEVRNKMYEASPYAVFVTAAGNRGIDGPDVPAGYSVGFGIVAGAVNSASQLWSASNGDAGPRTPYNYLLAPGVDVTAATRVGDSGNSHNTTQLTGTSAAAAQISGVIALMLQVNPTLGAREIESILIASADQVVTQTATVIHPPINATIYWAGASSDGSAAVAAATTDNHVTSASATSSHSQGTNAQATAIAANTTASYDPTLTATAAVDEAFASYEEAITGDDANTEDADTLDCLAADRTLV
jgi:hypothetical protein